MSTLEELQEFVYSPPKGEYKGPTYYMDQEIPVWSHPAVIAKGMLHRLYHRRFQGGMIIGTMGDGKTALAQCLAHQIHKHATDGFPVPIKDPDTGIVADKLIKWDFKVVWAGAHEFTHQEEFYANMPKFPTIVVYDDISGALKQIGEKQLEANFSTLSEIRWKLDPQTGLIPCIVIVNYHYSKNLEKEFRSVLGMDTIFTEVSNEERSNIDTIAPRGTLAHLMLENFDKISQPMINEHRFNLFLGNGKKIEYLTDQPFRCACAITKNDGKLILFSNKDCCDICVKKKLKHRVPAEVIYNEMMGLGYGSYCKKAIENSLFKRGYNIIHPYLTYATNYFETKILPRYDFDMGELAQFVKKMDHKPKIQPRKNRHQAKESESLSNIEAQSEVVEEPGS